MLAAIHHQGLSIIMDGHSDPEGAAYAAAAIRAMAQAGCRKVDAVARALGDPGFGTFDEDFAPITLGPGE